MPQPIEQIIADVIVDDLNGQVWSPTFTAVRLPVPDFKAEDLDGTLRCAVVANRIDTIEEARGGLWRFDYRIVIDFQTRVADPWTEGTIDTLGALVESVQDRYLETQRELTVTGLTTAHVAGADRPLAYDWQRLAEDGIFEAYVEVLVRGWK